MFKILSRLQESSSRLQGFKLIKPIWWIYTLHNPQGYFSGAWFFNLVYTLEDSFIFIGKAILGCIFYILTFGSSELNCEFIHREYGFSINLKIPFMSSSDHPVLTLKVSVMCFCRFWYCTDFDIKVLLLSQNSFVWIGFC